MRGERKRQAVQGECSTGFTAHLSSENPPPTSSSLVALALELLEAAGKG